MPDGVRGAIIVWVEGKKVEGEDPCDTLLRMSEKKRRPQQVFCYRAGHEAVGIVSSEPEGEVWIHHQPVDRYSWHLQEINFCLCFHW